MTDAVLGNTYDLPASAFAAFDRHGATQLVRREGAPRVPETAGLPNAKLFDLGGQIAPLSYPYGSAKLARKQYWAALEDLSMYSLTIGGTGMREPDWHPVTAELGDVHRGHGRMTVLSPDGSARHVRAASRDRSTSSRAHTRITSRRSRMTASTS